MLWIAFVDFGCLGGKILTIRKTFFLTALFFFDGVVMSGVMMFLVRVPCMVAYILPKTYNP